jgi:uncharacterized protein
MKQTITGVFISVVLFFNTISLAFAGFDDGVAAYERNDYTSALDEFLPIAQGGDVSAQFILGFMYEKGLGVPQDDVAAVEWYRKAAIQDDSDAQFILGIMYYKGRGVSQDHKKAVEWYRKAAEQSDAEAQFVLGLMYKDGKGVPKNGGEAARWFKKAAGQGYASAEWLLANMYRFGDGVPQDDVVAAEWFHKSAKSGDASSQNYLGNIYSEGRGVSQDHKKAVEWYRKAAEQGYAEAQFNLGNNYIAGEGVIKDVVEATKWFRKAAEQGDASAQYNLGLMHVNGAGIPQNYILAYMWWSLSANTGDKDALHNRNRLVKDMTRSQIAKAQKLVREWHPSAPQTDSPAPSDFIPRAGPLSKLKLYATGSGFIVNSSGFVLTNNHVVNGCSEIRVPSAISVKNLARDPQLDLALLKISGALLAQATFRQGRSIRPGDPVVVAGFPLHGVLTSDLNITTGNVSALAGPDNDRRLIQVTAPIQSGNSGGPLLDLSGNIIGVVVSKLNAVKLAELTGDIPQNVNFAINTDTVRAFLDTHGLLYDTANSEKLLPPADVADLARKFTVLIECWK